ncbi:MAG: hypothetical protein ACTHZ5_04705 [Micrococcaceae bacterium]
MSTRALNTSAPARRGWARRLVAGTAAVALGAAALVGLGAEQLVTAESASAAPRVSISGLNGTATVSASGNTDITVTGTGFQSVQGGFGGIYVLFGWVDDPSGGTWKPSAGGKTGSDYLYVPDTEAKDNAGYQRFVTFPGSGTAAAANGGELKADGSWSLTMRTPGAKFRGVDRNGQAKEIDCTQVSCGIITIGAHGVVNTTNETFTPVTFSGAANAEAATIATDSGAAAANRSDAAGSGSGGNEANPQQAAADALAASLGGSEDGASADGEAAEGDDAQSGTTEALGAGIASIGLQQQTVQLGRVLGFTGQGFSPGEQVVASLGGGATGAGPLTAGEYGEIAGAIPIPEDLLPGTHTIRLTGAGSAQTVEAEFTAVADPLAAAADEGTSPWTWGLITVLIVAGLILVFIIVSVVMALVRRRRARREDENARAWAEYEAYYGSEAAAAAAGESAAVPEDSFDDTEWEQELVGASTGRRRADAPTEALRTTEPGSGARH